MKFTTIYMHLINRHLRLRISAFKIRMHLINSHKKCVIPRKQVVHFYVSNSVVIRTFVLIYLPTNKSTRHNFCYNLERRRIENKAFAVVRIGKIPFLYHVVSCSYDNSV